MNYTIEQRPQHQPAVCFLLGIHQDEWFIRFQCPDAIFNSVLMSKTAFEQVCLELGYVPEDASTKHLRELRTKQNELAPLLVDLRDQLARITTDLAPVQEVARRLGELTKFADSIRVASEDIAYGDSGKFLEPAKAPDESTDGPSEPIADSQLDGIFPVGGKRKSAANS